MTQVVANCSEFSPERQMRAWQVRDEPYSKGLAELMNYQHRLPFAQHWDAGTTSSSDGQFYPVGGLGEHTGQVNLRYRSKPVVERETT